MDNTEMTRTEERLETYLIEVIDKFKFEFYRSIFSRVRERDGSLSAMEAFSLEVIHQLGQPTIGRFADFLGISQSNATYKVNSLVRKGYIEKQNSDQDRREYYLILTDKYYDYTDIMRSYVTKVSLRIGARFSERDVEKLAGMLEIISNDLMPEAIG